MSEYSEIDALKDVNDALSQLTDEPARQRVLSWLWDKFGAGTPPSPVPIRQEPDPPPPAGTTKKRSKKSGAQTSKRPSSSSRPTFDKSLDLKPKGKDSFADFAEAKKPRNNYEKCLVAVYYLRRVLEATASLNSVFTCYKEVGWRVPADLRNTLQSTASRKGWLDTSDTNDITLTTLGENHVEHDLPPETT